MARGAPRGNDRAGYSKKKDVVVVRDKTPWIIRTSKNTRKISKYDPWWTGGRGA